MNDDNSYVRRADYDRAEARENWINAALLVAIIAVGVTLGNLASYLISYPLDGWFMGAEYALEVVE